MKKIILLQFFCLSIGVIKAQWTTSGTNIYNSNTGNVGIGITNPQYRLHLFDNSSNQSPSLVLDGQNGMQAGFWLRNLNTNGKTYSLYSNADGNLIFGDENNFKARMIINNNGDISIHRNLSVGYLETGLTADIHLNGWLYSQKGVVANAGTHNWGVLHYQLHSQNKNRFSIGLNTEETGNNQGANFSIWRYNDDGSFLSHALTITRVNGNVGIGTNTPTEKLQIGDRFAIHDGGWKAILYNSTWNESLGFNTRNTNGSASALYFTDGGNVFFQTAPSGNAGTILNDAVQSLVVYNSGQIGIGTNHALTSLGDASTKLFIAGGVRARKIKVDQANWADFVFDNDYKLPTLAEVENYIRTHKHLKGVPTEKEVVKEGLDLGQTQAVLLQKIEELTLYIIEQNKKIEQLEKLRKEVEELKQILTSK